MFAEDLDAFFSTDEHALAGTLQGGAEVAVILDRGVVEAFGALVTSGPVALAKAADVSTSNLGQTLTIGGTAYTIRERHLLDDGAIVALHLQAP